MTTTQSMFPEHKIHHSNSHLLPVLLDQVSGVQVNTRSVLKSVYLYNISMFQVAEYNSENHLTSPLHSWYQRYDLLITITFNAYRRFLITTSLALSMLSLMYYDLLSYVKRLYQPVLPGTYISLCHDGQVLHQYDK